MGGELSLSALVWEHDATVEDADGRAIRVRLLGSGDTNHALFGAQAAAAAEETR